MNLPGGQLIQGSVEIRTLETLEDLSGILKSLTPAQALVYGVPINTASKIMTRKAFANAGNPEGATTRTNDAFSWPQGPGVLMLDYDPKAGAEALDRDKLVDAVPERGVGSG